MSTDLKRVSVDWETAARLVNIRWVERTTPSALWTERDQQYSTSFYVTSVEGLCDTDFIVAGVFKDGISIVEHWTFDPSDPTHQQRRDVVYRGEGIGRVMCVAPDPDKRFVLVLTYDNRSLYRIDLPSGTPVLLHNASTLPVIGTMKWIAPLQHVSEGRMFKLVQRRPWESGKLQGELVVMLPDANNDGVFDPPITLTNSQYIAAGYGEGANWESLCP